MSVKNISVIGSRGNIKKQIPPALVFSHMVTFTRVAKIVWC